MVLVILVGGCSGDRSGSGGELDPRDAGFADAGIGDGGSRDGGARDGGERDAGTLDAGRLDSGVRDGGFRDAGEIDAGEIDAGLADGGPSNDGGQTDAGAACTISGIYRATIAGASLFFRFDAVGTWAAAPSMAQLMSNPQGTGLYGFANGFLTISDTNVGCPPNQTGRYAVSFTPACDQFTVSLVNDPCGQRGAALNGATFVR